MGLCPLDGDGDRDGDRDEDGDGFLWVQASQESRDGAVPPGWGQGQGWGQG